MKSFRVGAFIFLGGIFFVTGVVGYRVRHHLWRMNQLRLGQQAALKADPMIHLAVLKGIPILLLHGSADTIVPASAHSQQVAARLPAIYRLVPGGGHGDPHCLDAATILNFIRRTAPPGTTVICLHACGGTARDWQMPADSAHAALVKALHGAGYPTLAESYGDTWGNDRAVAQVGRQIGKHRVVLLGESMGGLLALRYAEAHPSQTVAIIGVYPVCSLSDMMSRPTWMATGIRTAYAPPPE